MWLVEWLLASAFLLICFLPALILAKKTSFIFLRIFIWYPLLTLTFTMPALYSSPDSYEIYQEHFPFDFTAVESLYVSFSLGAFVLFVVMLVLTIERGLFINGMNNHCAYLRGVQPRSSALYHSRSSTQLYSLLIFGVIAISIPVIAWMFRNGIGITGVQPPHLPYRISGLTTYTIKLLVPILLMYLYVRTNRKSLLLVSLIAIYSIFLGIATSSRSAASIALIAPLAYAWFDRRWFLFILTCVFLSISLYFSTIVREQVHYVSDGVVTFSFISLNDVFSWLLSRSTIEELAWTIFEIIGRFESFKFMLLASNVNPDNIGGSAAFLLNLIQWDIIPMDSDMFHKEVRGFVVPRGFHSATGSFYSTVLMISNSGLVPVLAALIWLSLLFIILERLIIRIQLKYKIKRIFIMLVFSLFQISILTSTGWPINNLVIIMLFVVAYLPRQKFLRLLFERI